MRNFYLDKNETLSSRKTLNKLSNTLLSLLKQKSFEQISVKELCRESKTGRSTFYNYFDDIYDLLDYFWYFLRLKMGSLDCDSCDFETYLKLMLEKYINFLDENLDSVNLILKHNDVSDFLLSSFRNYLNDVVLYEIQSSLYDYKSDIPKDLLAEHYSNALITILELRYVYKKDYSKEEFIKYFLELMDNQKIKFSK